MMGGFGMGLGGIVSLVILGVLVWVGITLYRSSGVGGGRAPRLHGDSALETLKARYARGEIDRETYLRMRDDIE